MDTHKHRHLGIVHGVVLARVLQDAAALFLCLLTELDVGTLLILVLALPVNVKTGETWSQSEGGVISTHSILLCV